jgi:hypothetical protein
MGNSRIYPARAPRFRRAPQSDRARARRRNNSRAVRIYLVTHLRVGTGAGRRLHCRNRVRNESERGQSGHRLLNATAARLVAASFAMQATSPSHDTGEATAAPLGTAVTRMAKFTGRSASPTKHTVAPSYKGTSPGSGRGGSRSLTFPGVDPGYPSMKLQSVSRQSTIMGAG